MNNKIYSPQGGQERVGDFLVGGWELVRGQVKNKGIKEDTFFKNFFPDLFSLKIGQNIIVDASLKPFL